MTTPTIFDQIERDREAGTPGPWGVVGNQPTTLWGYDPRQPNWPWILADFGSGAGEQGDDDLANTRRAARVPDLEAIVLASKGMEEALAALLTNTSPAGLRVGEASLAAYRAAVAEIQSRPDQSGRG